MNYKELDVFRHQTQKKKYKINLFLTVVIIYIQLVIERIFHFENYISY